MQELSSESSSPNLPEERANPQPSWGLTLMAVVPLVYVLIPMAIMLLVVDTGLGEVLYGPDAAPAASRQATGGEANETTLRLSLLTSTLALPLQVVAIPLLFFVLNRMPPRDMGLTLDRAPRHAALGAGLWLLVMPGVLGLHLLVGWLWQKVVPEGVRQHEFERLARGNHLVPAELGMIVFLSMIAAPLLEEMIFRGLLLRWAQERLAVRLVVIVWALLAPVMVSREQWSVVLSEGTVAQWAQALAPQLFVLTMLPGFLMVERHDPTGRWPSVYVTALMFAMVHSAWPAPVPLFVLGVVLGWLAQRTQGLVAPMVLHALFNSVACVQMLYFL